MEDRKPNFMLADEGKRRNRSNLKHVTLLRRDISVTPACCFFSETRFLPRFLLWQQSFGLAFLLEVERVWRRRKEKGVGIKQRNHASKTVADIIRTTLGPRSMLKMLLDASGGIVVTNDGNAILRELDIADPAAKSFLGI